MKQFANSDILKDKVPQVILYQQSLRIRGLNRPITRAQKKKTVSNGQIYIFSKKTTIPWTSWQFIPLTTCLRSLLPCSSTHSRSVFNWTLVPSTHYSTYRTGRISDDRSFIQGQFFVMFFVSLFKSSAQLHQSQNRRRHQVASSCNS